MHLALVGQEKEVALLALELGHDIAITIEEGSDEDWSNSSDLFAAMTLDSPQRKAALVPAIYAVDKLATLISPRASIGSVEVECGPGCLIQSGVLVTVSVKLGMCCKLNHGVTVHHDCEIGDFCTLAPGCRLLGNVKLGNRVFVGAGAIILPRVSIGDDAIIAAGATVIQDVPAEFTSFGRFGR